MGIVSGLVLFAVIWFLVLFVVLPLRMTSQGDAGVVVPGTHSSAPADAQIGRKARITTFWALGIWAIVAGTILSGAITVRDLDWFERMSTPEVSLPD
jgi:predicted secreted protein